MARRRPSSNVPMTVLGVGLLVVMMFGVGIIHFSHNTPILQLRPLLEQEFGVPGFETRFRPGQPPAVEVFVPDAVLERASLDEVALYALGRYKQLAKQTRVRTLKARSKDDPEQPWVEVTMLMLQHQERALQALPVMIALVEDEQVADVELTLAGVGRRGVRVEVRGLVRLPRAVKRAEALSKTLATELGRLSWVGVAQVTLRTGDGKTYTSASGPDLLR